MKDRQTIIDKVKKLRAMGASDNVFEATTALQHFEAMKAKHNITEQELDDEVLERWVIKYKNWTLFCQVLHSLGLTPDCYKVISPNKDKFLRSQTCLKLTLLDYLALKSKYDFYQNEYTRKIKQEDKDLYQRSPKAYVIAFVSKNNLFSDTDNEVETTKKRKVSKHIEMAVMMTLFIEKSTFYKAIA